MTRLPQSVREQVRQRADERCEYCHKPEGFSAHPHHVDHIISQKHNGSDELDNLAWACFQCNVNKGTDIAALDPDTGTLTSLFNPRTQVWADHFSLEGALVIGLTPPGRATIQLLQVNHPEQIETRQLLIEAGIWP